MRRDATGTTPPRDAGGDGLHGALPLQAVPLEAEELERGHAVQRAQAVGEGVLGERAVDPAPAAHTQQPYATQRGVRGPGAGLQQWRLHAVLKKVTKHSSPGLPQLFRGYNFVLTILQLYT